MSSSSSSSFNNISSSSKVCQIVQVNERAVELMRRERYMAAAAVLSQTVSKLEAFVEDAAERREQQQQQQQMLLQCDPYNSNNSMSLYEEFSSSSSSSLSLEGHDVDMAGSSNSPQQQQDDFDDDDDCIFTAEFMSLPQEKDLDAADALNPYQLYTSPASMTAVTKQQHYRLDDAIFNNERQHAKLSCILYYNLGLCFQLHAQVATTGRQSIFLRDAHLSYQTALGLLDEESQHLADMQLELALLNNFGHLHYGVLNMPATATCLERIQFILCDITDDGEEAVPAAMQCFYLNLIHNENLHLRAAPVA